jgi:hypothetical protein
MTGFADPITDGGGNLQIPEVQSPNFVTGVSGWIIRQDGSAEFHNVTVSGGSLIVASGGTGIFFYGGTPAAGNLVGSWAMQAGTDTFGNTYPAGLQIGTTGGQQIFMLPQSTTGQINITAALAGVIQAVVQTVTSDANQMIPGLIGGVLLGTGTATKMSTLMSSPIGTGSGAALILEAQNDAGTDNPVITFGTVATQDSGQTITFTPIASLGPYYFLIYSGTSGIVTVTKTSGSGNISIPASASATAKGEAWGAGASEAGTSGGVGVAEGGCGGGGYSQEPALAITAGGNVAYSVPASANAVGGSPADCTLTGTSVTVTAHSGQAGTGASHGAGGPASGNTISYVGGSGGTRSTHTPNAGGGGGGGAAGPTGGGNDGNGGSPTLGGLGGLGVGGANGGNGGAPSNNAIAGRAPGGGGGGGGSGASGAIGGAGQVRLTYTTGSPKIMFSIAQAAGTDQFGTAFTEGIHFVDPSDGNTYSIGTVRQTTTSTPTIGSTTAANLAGISITVGVGTYYYRAVVGLNEIAANSAFVVLGCSATGTIQGLVTYLSTTAICKPQTAFSNAGLNSSALVAGSSTYCELEGTITLTGSGAVTISLAASANANTFSVIAGAFLELRKK